MSAGLSFIIHKGVELDDTYHMLQLESEKEETYLKFILLTKEIKWSAQTDNFSTYLQSW